MMLNVCRLTKVQAVRFMVAFRVVGSVLLLRLHCLVPLVARLCPGLSI